MPDQQSRVTVSVWSPGALPVPGNAIPDDAPTGTLVWVDLDKSGVPEALGAIEPLGLPQLHPQMVEHLVTNVSPDDPQGESLIDDFDASVASQLRSGSPVKLLQTFEPVFVAFTGTKPRRWSYVTSRIGLLAGTNWLITYRGPAFDVRFAGGYEGLAGTSHEQLIEAARDFTRTDQLPADVATLMRRWLARRARIVGAEIYEVVGQPVMDMHRTLIEGELAAANTIADIRFELFDLRWVLDSHEGSCARQLPERSDQVEAFHRGLRDGAQADQVLGIYRATLVETGESRRSVQEALGWLTGEQIAQLLGEQAQAGRRAETLQRLVGLLTIFVLGPTLVASLFGAQAAWLDDHQEVRSLLMVVGVMASAAAGWFLVDRWGHQKNGDSASDAGDAERSGSIAQGQTGDYAQGVATTPERPRVVIHDDRVYTLASDYTPEEIAAIVRSEGSVAAAAAKLGLEQRAVQAAADAHSRGTRETVTPTKPLDVIKDVFGLFAGIGILVYILGGVVLFARLSFEDLPAEAVLAQLPREFLLTIGVGQVFLPALLLTAAHVALRTVRHERAFRAKKGWVILIALGWLAAILGLMALVADTANDELAPLLERDDLGFWIAAIVSLVAAIGGAAFVRYKFSKGSLQWKRGSRWLTLTLAYGLAAMVAATFVAATFPLLDARACTSVGFAENGKLVGSNGDRVFLGEDVPGNRRIASLPASDVEELFVGEAAAQATCDPRGPAAAVTAQAQAERARETVATAELHLAEVRKATRSQPLAAAAVKLADATTEAARSSRVVADAAESVLDDAVARAVVDDLGSHAREVAALSGTANERANQLRKLAERATTDPSARAELTELAEQTVVSARLAATEAGALADEALEAVKRMAA